MTVTPSSSTKPALSNPLIPEKYLDVPSQRLYYLSLGLLCQSIKIIDFIWSLASGEDRLITCRKWLLVDFTYIIVLALLRIPRLEYSKASVILQIGMLWFLDGVLFGGININLGAFLGSNIGFTTKLSGLSSTPEAFSIRDVLSPITFGLVAPSTSRDSHLLGQHTVRMSPISTAHLNPQNLNFCLSPTNPRALIPIVLNNTNIIGLRYSVTPLGYLEDGSKGGITTHDVSSKELKAILQSQVTVARPIPTNYIQEEYDEYDDEDEDEDASSRLQKTESMAYIPLTKPGIVRLERVIDQSHSDARLIMSETIIVPCPQVEFAKDEGSAVEPVRCTGQNVDAQLKINVKGVPPLSLRWIRTINRNREQFLVEGIEGDHKDVTAAPAEDIEAPEYVDTRSLAHLSANARVPSPQDVTVPLTISLPKPGTYLYALEEITDGVGNTVRVGIDEPSADTQSISKTKTTRSFIVLEKPVVSFGHCSSDTPASLLKDSEATIDIRTQHIDSFDVPLDVSLMFEPTPDSKGKRPKAWKKTLQLDANDRNLNFRVNQPGEYKILGVKGKYCTGTVQAPDVCRVVEKPLPDANIVWKRIHECSGATGVSVSVVLHGTPPFHVYYRMQRDNEPPREIPKMITSSRTELTLQPERSGKYTFTFFAVSDANYQKVQLPQPVTIDQIIHPLASAEFANTPSGRSKKIVSTCVGDTVDIGVDLRGTGPWNLEVQVIGPEKAELIQVQGIETPRKTLTIPIPTELRKNGGSFEIDLVSVEDASKCKRDVSVPGVQVKVKRVVPTVQFYGKEGERNIVVTENEKANLPLRLTGDGPWSVVYKRHQSGAVMTNTFSDRNANIQVMDQGVYELLSVTDSQCPGVVVPEGSTYSVEWIPRPSARLSPAIQAVRDAYNGSYILQPICEGANSHVDLELTGRPPFQIMYNIAQNSESGGTKIVGQPTFNSIQPRTRFQLTTSTPGRVYYEVKQIGDSAYPLAKSKDRTIPRNQRLLFEQEVALRPSARFRNRNRLTYCLHDTFVPMDNTNAGDGVIVFEGLPPFTVGLAIKNVAASSVERQTITVPGNTWRVDVPNYTFSSIGPHLVSIESVTDASGCAHAALDPEQRTLWADVAEAAAIIPLERREDICVGDVTSFQLEGIPPWTVGYTVNGRSHTRAARTSPFSVVQQQPGMFAVTSIAHAQKMCKAAVADLRFRVHNLPSAQVGHGKRIFQDIHEGDQAEIVFTLIGEPPFTFTYQRSELPPKKGVVGKVLETHTVSRVQTNEYSIFSALEGTWTVTSISDKFCRYPPLQPDSALEKHK